MDKKIASVIAVIVSVITYIACESGIIQGIPNV